MYRLVISGRGVGGWRRGGMEGRGGGGGGGEGARGGGAAMGGVAASVWRAEGRKFRFKKDTAGWYLPKTEGGEDKFLGGVGVVGVRDCESNPG